MLARTGIRDLAPIGTKLMAWVARDTSSPTITLSPTGSTRTLSPVANSLAPGQDTTAAIFLERQMIAVCEVGPPFRVTTPTTASVNCAVSAGEKSSPTRTMRPFVGRSRSNLIPANFA